MKKDQCVYFLLSDTGTILANLIKFFSGERLVHSSISFDPGLKRMYSFGRIWPRFPLYGGFVTENARGGLFRIKRHMYCEVYRLQISTNEKRKLRKLLSAFEDDNKKYRYNLSGLFGFGLNRPIQKSKNHYFCSQFIAEVLDESGIHSFKKPAPLVKPADCLTLPGLKQIYAGNLSGYLEQYKFPNCKKAQKAI